MTSLPAVAKIKTAPRPIDPKNRPKMRMTELLKKKKKWLNAREKKKA
jgi:hypothetical protein